MLRTPARVRLLSYGDRDAVRRVLDTDPVTHVFVDHRLRLTNLDPRWLGGEVWGYETGGELRSLCHAAANLIPVNTTPDALTAFAARALQQGRRCGSIGGIDDEVRALWDMLSPEWGPARLIRPRQPYLVIDHEPRTPPDRRVRRVRSDELDLLYPACVAMSTEELEQSPELGDGGSMYRSRVAQLIAKGHAFAWIESGRVVFKAEVGAVTPYACQVQGVWIDPRFRGRGLSAPAMAAVCDLALRSIAPVVTLYVNEHNHPARRCYERVGFRETARYATVLF